MIGRVFVVVVALGVVVSPAPAANVWAPLSATVVFGDDEFLWTMAVSPDELHVYVGGTHSVTAHRVDAATGQLALVERHDRADEPALDDVRAIVLSPGGEHLYAACGGPRAWPGGRLRPGCGDG